MTKEEKEKNLLDKLNKFREALKSPKTSMTDDKLSELKKNVLESLSLDRQKLVARMPFTGGMLMHFEMLPVRDWRLGTASTDGSRIYFDIDFYSRLTDNERMFVLAHECWHCIYLHFLRCQGRESNLWNIATDCEINYMLKSNGFTSPEELCYPEKCDEGKSAEEIYERLLKKMKKNKGNQGKQNEDDGSGKGSSSKDSGNQSSGKNADSKSGSDDSENGNKKGLTGQFDKHVTDDDKEGGMLPKDKWGEKGEDSDYRPKVDCDVAEKIRESVISEAQKYERTRGTLPGGVDGIVKKFRKPEISWRELLCQEITKCYSERREWLPPNRRYVHKGLYLQSHRGEKVKVTTIVDTSGSTTADLPKFMGELVGLLNTFSNYDMTLIQCDADVQSVEKYDDCNPFPVENAEKIKLSGFGGSDLCPAFEYINNGMEEELPNMVVVFTDGFISFPQERPPYNVLCILTSDGAKEGVPDWCRKIYFKEKRNLDSDDV